MQELRQKKAVIFDLVLSHRVTAAMDVGALNQIMSNYMTYTLEKYLDSLPRVRGPQ